MTRRQRQARTLALVTLTALSGWQITSAQQRVGDAHHRPPYTTPALTTTSQEARP